MTIRTIVAATAIALVSVSFNASAQAYHRPIHVDQFNDQAILDSNDEAHLQVSVRQSAPDSLKFNVVVINPFVKDATITIRKGGEVFYSFSGIKGDYFNVFDFSQLEDGNYAVIVSAGGEKIRKDITIRTEIRTDRQVQVN